MSVLVKGMKMPTGCDDCPLYGIDMRCNITYTPNYTDGRFVERLGNCPLVDVPPHGRLIDADALIEDLERQCKEVFRIDAVSPDDYWITRNEAYNEALWKSWVESFGDYLKTRPTIIEAEEET